MVDKVRFEARIRELVEDLPDVAELVEPRLIVRRALGQNFANLQRTGWIPSEWRAGSTNNAVAKIVGRRG